MWQDHLPSKPIHNQRKMLSIEGAMEVESWTSDNSFHDKTTKKEDEFARVQWPLWDAKVKHKFMAEQTSLVTSLVLWPAAWCSWGRVVDEARVRLFADCTFLPADLAHVHKSITKVSSLLVVHVKVFWPIENITAHNVFAAARFKIMKSIGFPIKSIAGLIFVMLGRSGH